MAPVAEKVYVVVPEYVATAVLVNQALSVLNVAVTVYMALAAFKGSTVTLPMVTSAATTAGKEVGGVGAVRGPPHAFDSIVSVGMKIFCVMLERVSR